MKKFSPIICGISLMLVFSILFGCGFAQENTLPRVECTITKYAEYDNVYLQISQEDFKAAGFELGDSCDVVFENGVTYENVPFYSGYYGNVGDTVLVAYQNEPMMIFASVSSGNWKKDHQHEGDHVTVTLREKGAFLDMEEVFSMTYSDDAAEFADDVTFANFREMKGGNLLPGMFYRGASPVDNAHKRAKTTDDLLRANGIAFVLDLADSQEELEKFRQEKHFASDYFVSLYEAGNVALLDLNASFRKEKYAQTLAGGLRMMMTHSGPYYIHCQEGKDRTGFVCLLLEGLAGATMEEVEADYMETYRNYFGITKDSQPWKYTAIVSTRFEDMAGWLCTLADGSLKAGCESYLRTAGMTDEEITTLEQVLTGK